LWPPAGKEGGDPMTFSDSFIIGWLLGAITGLLGALLYLSL